MVEKKRNSNSKKVNSRKSSTINNNNNNRNNNSVIESKVINNSNNSSNNIINKGGRPPIVKSVEDLEQKIEDYFRIQDEREKPYTVPGLAYHLGFAQRTQLADLAHDKPAYSDTIRRARMKIEAQRNEQLIENNNGNIRFDLCNNFNWKEKQETELTGNMNITFAGSLDELKKRETK